MFYSSGTTGQPKGILPPLPEGDLGAPSFLTGMLKGLFGFNGDTVYLSPGAPLYHAAPAGWTYGTQRLGGTAIVMERFEPLEVLAAIERHRVTHVQFVPTHMIRMLRLTAEERSRFDLSSLQVVVPRGGALSGRHQARIHRVDRPDRPRVLQRQRRRRTLLRELAGLAQAPGHGRPVDERHDSHRRRRRQRRYRSARRARCGSRPTATSSTTRTPRRPSAAHDPRGWAWMGDVGRVDDEGYLYLTDRASNMIISGGVNIYPREIEDVITAHHAVDDVAVIGTPDEDMGEHVTAFVQLKPGASARRLTN